MGLKRKIAFTLAEVLITLGVIGIVAEMTIPTLIQNVNEKVTVTELKKAYSTMSNAYTLAVQENGTPDEWNLVAMNDPGGAENILNILAPFLRITKNCGRNPGCWPNVVYREINGGPSQAVDTNPAFAKAQLADGSLFIAYSYGNCNLDHGTTEALSKVCGYFTVDINGDKSPNQIGIDTFRFYLTKKGIIPNGTKPEYSYSFDSDCRDRATATYGLGCAAWVLYNENQDYLHCNNLSWDGPTKCN